VCVCVCACVSRYRQVRKDQSALDFFRCQRKERQSEMRQASKAGKKEGDHPII